MRLVRCYSEMMELNLSLGPGQGGCTFVCSDIVVLIGQADNLIARTSEQCPKREANGRAGRDADAPADAEDRIENRPDGVRERPTAADRYRRAHAVPTSQEACPVGLVLQFVGGLTFQYGQMGGPYLWFLRCPPSAGSQKRTELRNEFGLYKKL